MRVRKLSSLATVMRLDKIFVKTFIAAATIIITTTAANVFADDGVLLDIDFDAHPAGQYTEQMARADFRDLWSSSITAVNAGRGEIVAGHDGAGNALRMLYPANTFGTANHGIQIRESLRRAVDTAWASYWVKFDDGAGGFDFVRGGKLPGLCGNQCITGGNDANGYNGWSARIMWRGEGVATQYMYYVTNAGFGEDLVFDESAPVKRFAPGTWHRLNTQIIMNTPGAADGVIRSWFDGELAMERNNILIRHIDTLRINWFYVSTFFGGSDATWAPRADMYITFDDFLVVANPESSRPQALYKLSAASGRVPFTVHADMSASLGAGLTYSVTAPGAREATTGDLRVRSLTYDAPGLYRIDVEVRDGAGRSSVAGRSVVALGERDLLINNLWERMPLGASSADTLMNGDSLRLYLTIIDADARIIIGPANASDPGNLTQPQEALFFGVLQYQNGTFAALDGTSREYVVMPSTEIFGAGTYEVIFILRGNATTLSTYDVSIYKTSGELIYEWTDMPRRAFAQSGRIGNYAAWSSRDFAAVVHMEPFAEVETSVCPPRASRTSRSSATITHVARAQRNGILFNISMMTLSSSPSSTTSPMTATSSRAQPQIEIFNARGRLIRRVSIRSLQSSSVNGMTNTFVQVPSRGVYLYRITSGGTNANIVSGSVVVR